MIKLNVIGHIGNDALVNNVNGKLVINFNVAHSEKYKNNEGVQVNRTTWVNCAYWTERTGIAPYLKKGTQVYVEGQPDVRTYTTKEGVNGATLSLRVSSVQLLGSRPSEGGSAGGYQPAPAVASQPSAPAASDITEAFDDLPF